MLRIRVATNSEYGPNTKYFHFWKVNKYQIILFLKIDWIMNTNSTIWTLLFKYRILNNIVVSLWKFFNYLVFNNNYFGYSKIIWKLQMDQIPNMNSTIWSQLFEYLIIRIICCNSVADSPGGLSGGLNLL